MIIITGSVTARPESLEEIEALSLAHVQRSRLEPGCLAHGVHRDVENPMRLVFLEQWQDQAAVDTHFAVPEAGAFVTSLMKLADPDARSTLEIFETK
jgi:quinol monooxygenase YgiN